MPASLVSIVLATRNRPVELARALASCFAQTYRPIEVLVYDDASGPDVERVVRGFPQAKYERSDDARGSIVLRNRGFHAAHGEYILSLDDDAYLTSKDTLQPVVAQFEANPSCAIIALPLIEPATGSRTGLIQAGRSLPPGTPLRNYRGSAAVLHRRRVLEAGAYREPLIHQSEERDLAVRILQLGYSVLLGDAPPAVHTPSPARDRDRLDWLGIRNSFLFDLWNIPHPYLAPRLAADAIRLFFYRLSLGGLARKIRHILGGLRDAWALRALRRPVSVRTWRQYSRLERHGPRLLPASELPPPAASKETVA